MYRLIASDMDGTLLNDKLEITDRTAAAVRRAVDQGAMFVVASGRPFAGVQRYMDSLGIGGSVITYNGAKVVRYTPNAPEESRVVAFNVVNMSSEDVIAILRLAEQLDTTVCLWSDEELYVNRMNELVTKYCEHSGSIPCLLPPIEETASLKVSKILWYDDPERIEGWLQTDMFDGLTQTAYMRSNPEFLEFMSNKADKGTAVAVIAGYYGIRTSEILAFGDGENDITMLDYAGCGVAMANAAGEVKKHADAITVSNTEDGVAVFLENLFP